MSSSALAGRYAKALFELAEKNNSASKVEQDLIHLADIVSGDAKLAGILKNPSISRSNIISAMQAIIKKLGADKLTGNFIAILANNGRIRHLQNVAKEYLNLIMQSRGEEKAYITTAIPLDKSQVAEIEKNLGNVLKSKIKAEVTINDSILGGIIVRVGSKMLDASLLGKLEKLEMLNKKAIANL